MTPEQVLSPRLREGLINRFLGGDSKRAYLTRENEFIFLSRLRDTDDAVMLVSLDIQAGTLTAGTYSAGPVREVTNDDILFGADRETHLDALLLRLRNEDKPLDGKKKAEAFELLKDFASERFQEFSTLSSDIVTAIRRELDVQDPQLPPEKFEVEALMALFRGVRIEARKNQWYEWANDQVVASAMCRIPDILTGQNSITITASPRFNQQIDLPMNHVPIWLKDSKGRVLEPQFDIIPGAAVFLGIQKGEIYTVI